MHTRPALALLLSAVFVSACGGSSTSPAPTPSPIATTISLSGTVKAFDGRTITGAVVTFLDGPNKGRSTTTNAGAYSFTGLAAGGSNLSAERGDIGFTTSVKGVVLSGANTLDFTLDAPLFSRSGFGNDVFTLPVYTSKVHVTGHFVDKGSNSNFIVHLNGASLINEILRQTDYDGTHLTTNGGTIEIVSSGSIQWSFTEVR